MVGIQAQGRTGEEVSPKIRKRVIQQTALPETHPTHLPPGVVRPLAFGLQELLMPWEQPLLPLQGEDQAVPLTHSAWP